jgi:hypothetical protein
MKNARIVSALLALTAAGCAAMAGGRNVVHAPRVRSAADRQAELSLSPGGTPSAATLRLFARIHNPNHGKLNLNEIKGSLFLAGQPAADVDAPLDLELKGREETVVPIDVKVPLDKDPSLARTLAPGAVVAYRVDGTMGVETRQGEPVFGPLTLLEGEARVH